MSLRAILSEYWFAIQQELFPALKEEIGPLGERYQTLIAVLEFVRVERQLPYVHGLRGRPQEDRAALARAFIAKAVFDITTTRALIERLTIDRPLRRLCGWSSVREVPSEATFSRAFAAFADSGLPSRLHEALLEKTMQDHLVGHISRDSTAIEGREKPTPKPAPPPAPKRKRGRPRKGEQRPAKEPRRLQRQLEMPVPQMVADLPTACDVGTKRNAKGHQTSWIGYKL
jgi:transposase